MKRESLAKDLLRTSIIGFTTGVTLLLVSYIGVYFIVGESAFIEEMRQLNNITTLLVQLISIGISYSITFIIFRINMYLLDKDYASKCPHKTILSAILILVMNFVLVLDLLPNMNFYSENIGNMNIIIFVAIYGFGILGLCVKSFIESELIKKINYKLKEKNANED